MTPDDPTRPDDDDDDVLGPDAEPDAAERARARGFADLIDKVMAGRTPAAVPAEDQALLEVATAIRATVRPVELAPSRQRSIIESALATAIDRRSTGAGASASSLPVASGAAVRPIGSAPVRRSGRRGMPWIVAAVASVVAAAAIALLVVGRRPAPAPQVSSREPVVRRLPFDQRSRPADRLVGAIARERAGDALGRIDAIYADRLSGFRDRTLAAAVPAAGGSP